MTVIGIVLLLQFAIIAFVLFTYMSLIDALKRSTDLITANQVIIDNKIEKLGAIILKKDNQIINLN